MIFHGPRTTPSLRTQQPGKISHDLQGQEPSGMYNMLLQVVEKPMLELVMECTRSNQSKAAQWLGINRNTLRKLLVQHGMLNNGESR